MRWLILLALMALSSAQQAQPQQVNTDNQSGKTTYFLIDASGSMTAGTSASAAEEEVLVILTPLRTEAPEALVSRTYFRATNRDLCSHPFKISEPTSATNSTREQIAAGNNDYTPLGGVLQAAIQHVGENPAEIFLVTDGVQSPDCGPDVCAVARNLLPIKSFKVRVLPVGNNLAATEIARCIDQAQNRLPDDLPGTGKVEEPVKTEWDAAKPFERWLWLIITLLMITSCIVFGRRDGERAKGFEYHAGNIQDNERKLLSKPDNAAELRKQIATSSAFEEPELSWHRGASLTLLVVSLFMTAWMLFFDWSAGDFELSTSRQMAWFVLSSNFSTAFAILVVTPIVFAFSQNWRRLQAKRTFAFVAGLAAQEEAARLRNEHEALYNSYLAVRDSILRTQISTSWSNPNRFVLRSAQKFPHFSDDDLQRIERVKKKLIQIAQGPVLERADNGPDQIAAAKKKIEGFAPRLLRRNVTMEQLIAEVKANGWFGDKAEDWTALGDAIRLRNVPAIKRTLSALD